ncbi:MAG: hypothetical protein ACLQBJ_10865 [Bryobacteraceae bacterium]
MPRRFLRFCLCAWIGAAALAQQRPADPALIVGDLDKQIAPLALSWLHSPDPRFQAWGAYLILRDRHTEAIPDLLAMLSGFQVVESPATVADGDQHDALLGVLDALIQLGADVPAADAQRLYPEFPVQSLILLSRSQENAAPALLEIFKTDQRRPGAWLAAGDLLVYRTDSGFAAAVVEGMTIHAEVTVTDPNGGFGRGGSAFCCGAGPAPHAKEGWPPLGVYGLGGCGDRVEIGATILAAGIDPAYYHRQVTDSYELSGVSGCGCNPDQDLVRQHYLTTLLYASPEDPPLRAHVSQTIVWESPQAYSGALAGFVAGEQRLFADLAGRLMRQSLLSETEAATLRPQLQIHIFDYRSSREPALPTLAPLPENVTIESN